MTMARLIRMLGAMAVITTLAGLAPIGAQPTFEGAPDSRRGVFIRLVDPLDDLRGFCVYIPGHLQGVDLTAALVVHTCKDGFWNYDERFDEAVLQNQGLLQMPAFDLCLGAGSAEPGSPLRLMRCDASNPNQGWKHSAGRLRLKAHPELCLAVADVASTVSRGTRNHPVRHLVRPLTLAPCAPAPAPLQVWSFTPPSNIPGVRYPDGAIQGQ